MNISEVAVLKKCLEECREYFGLRSDCDHNGVNFVANEENKMLGVVEIALAALSALSQDKKEETK